jgi:shikimate dehydrogenase
VGKAPVPLPTKLLLFRFDSNRVKKMDRYAVFGNPISQSKSPFIHTLFARQTQQQMEYTSIEASVDGFTKAVEAFRSAGGRGCNITAPFKEEAFAMAGQLSERARLAGAVNTLKWTDDGVLWGDTTDGAGLLGDLKEQFGDLKDKRILLLGAGGAARGVIQPLLVAQPAVLMVANRTESKAIELAEHFAPFGQIRASNFERLSCEYDLVINSTSAGLSGRLPAIPTLVFHGGVDCYDMTYGSGLTAFNRWAVEQGARHVVDGLGMLVGQAAESFAVWRGIRPGTRQVVRELRRNLGHI